ncbi:MAG: hypothetical protein Q9167_007582 [Letrouitia subvulpina]
MPIFHPWDHSQKSISPVPKSVEGCDDNVAMKKPSKGRDYTQYYGGLIGKSVDHPIDGPVDGPVGGPVGGNVDGPNVLSKEKESRSNNVYGVDRSGGGIRTSDRRELMERIKRGESPTWVPSETLQKIVQDEERRSRSPPKTSSPNTPYALLPAPEIKIIKRQSSQEPSQDLCSPSEIQRPSSALHAGDFKGDSRKPQLSCCSASHNGPSSEDAFSTPFESSRTEPWDIPYSSFQNSYHDPQASSGSLLSQWLDRSPSGRRAPSLGSFPSNYVFKHPTTPLVQQFNSTDFDSTPINVSTSPSKSNRRHTLPPRPPLNLQFSPGAHSPTTQSSERHTEYHRESSFQYRNHRARASLTSNSSLQAPKSPQTPIFLRSRRTSFSSEASPLHNASMVGSYEESILRGWMSTAPSKPLDFTAQIGALGKGNCKPKFPAHVTIPFPAVFYSWSAGHGRAQNATEDEPSPYVGHIDLQSLPSLPQGKGEQRKRSRSPAADFNSTVNDISQDLRLNRSSSTASIKRRKKRRRTSSPAVPSCGCYRIPQQGQLQIVIRNPNKTAVKLFLVPYDLTDMKPGTKTFIRQRCYSTDPVIDSVSSSRLSLDPNQNTHKVNLFDKRPTLRYLIHVNICSPTKDRFYLYQHIRVVFANRVPDNKEQLRTDIQWPQPRYSSYNPGAALSRSSSNAGANLAVEKAYRRRSSGVDGNLMTDDAYPQFYTNDSSVPFRFGSPPPPLPDLPLKPAMAKRGLQDDYRAVENSYFDFGAAQTYENQSSFGYNVSIKARGTATPVPPMPFDLPLPRTRPKTENNSPGDGNAMDLDSSSRPTTSSGVQSPLSDKSNTFRGLMSNSFKSNSSNSSEGCNKFGRSDFKRPMTPEPGEGLLARKLRGLGVKKESSFEEMCD